MPNYSLSEGCLGIPGLGSMPGGCRPLISFLPSDTIAYEGSGASCEPLKLEIKISQEENNSLQVLSDGLFVSPFDASAFTAEILEETDNRYVSKVTGLVQKIDVQNEFGLILQGSRSEEYSQVSVWGNFQVNNGTLYTYGGAGFYYSGEDEFGFASYTKSLFADDVTFYNPILSQGQITNYSGIDTYGGLRGGRIADDPPGTPQYAFNATSDNVTLKKPLLLNDSLIAGSALFESDSPTILKRVTPGNTNNQIEFHNSASAVLGYIAGGTSGNLTVHGLNNLFLSATQRIQTNAVFGIGIQPTGTWLHLAASAANRSALRFTTGAVPTSNLTDGDVWYNTGVLSINAGGESKAFSLINADGTINLYGNINLSTTAYIGAPSASTVGLYTSGTLRLRQANGVLGIGTTVVIGSTSAGIPNSHLSIIASTAIRSHLRLASGVAPTTPVDGDVWFDGLKLYMRISGITKEFVME